MGFWEEAQAMAPQLTGLRVGIPPSPRGEPPGILDGRAH